jgi:hypothetical protein
MKERRSEVKILHFDFSSFKQRLARAGSAFDRVSQIDG